MSLNPGFRKDLYRKMLLVRRYEQLIEKKKVEGDLVSWVPIGTGQEAIGVGMVAALLPDDYYQVSHRGCAPQIAKGAPIKGLLAVL